jgi:hypothetical protein
MVLRRIFGPRRDEVTGEWRRLHNKELNDLYCSSNIVRVIKSRRMRWAGHVARMGDERGVYRVLVGKPEGKKPLGRHRRRWVDNIRKDLQEVQCGYMDSIGLAQDRDRWRTLVSAVMNLRVPCNAGNCLTSCKPDSCSGRTLHHAVNKPTCVTVARGPFGSSPTGPGVNVRPRTGTSLVARWPPPPPFPNPLPAQNLIFTSMLQFLPHVQVLYLTSPISSYDICFHNELLLHIAVIG